MAAHKKDRCRREMVASPKIPAAGTRSRPGPHWMRQPTPLPTIPSAKPMCRFASPRSRRANRTPNSMPMPMCWQPRVRSLRSVPPPGRRAPSETTARSKIALHATGCRCGATCPAGACRRKEVGRASILPSGSSFALALVTRQNNRSGSCRLPGRPARRGSGSREVDHRAIEPFDDDACPVRVAEIGERPAGLAPTESPAARHAEGRQVLGMWSAYSLTVAVGSSSFITAGRSIGMGGVPAAKLRIHASWISVVQRASAKRSPAACDDDLPGLG
jgi:hypothetical protein